MWRLGAIRDTIGRRGWPSPIAEVVARGCNMVNRAAHNLTVSITDGKDDGMAVPYQEAKLATWDLFSCPFHYAASISSDNRKVDATCWRGIRRGSFWRKRLAS